MSNPDLACVLCVAADAAQFVAGFGLAWWGLCLFWMVFEGEDTW